MKINPYQFKRLHAFEPKSSLKLYQHWLKALINQKYLTTFFFYFTSNIITHNKQYFSDHSMNDLFEGLISSKTRIRLLMRFFFNPGTKAYLRELSNDLHISSNAVREELNQLTKSQLLTSQKKGRKVFYTANNHHPLFPELRSMVSKVMGLDQVIESILTRLGDLEKAYLIDDYAEGKDTGIIDIVLVGSIDHYQLNDLSRKTERYIKRKIRSLVLTKEEFENFFFNLQERPNLLVWEKTDCCEQNGKDDNL